MTDSLTARVEKQPPAQTQQPPVHTQQPPGYTQPTDAQTQQPPAHTQPTYGHKNHLTTWQLWVRRPQRLWLRRALFQVHLWVGIGLGLYVLVISISGSLVVYRPQLSKKFSRAEIILLHSASRMTSAQQEENARRLYSGYQVDYVSESRRPDRPSTI